ncbi:MAG: hypothetical protein JXA83_10680 [Acidimicrobiales bacterium]|nr:hypothetical protein [Acidimicrobiales bacterium]
MAGAVAMAAAAGVANRRRRRRRSTPVPPEQTMAGPPRSLTASAAPVRPETTGTAPVRSDDGTDGDTHAPEATPTQHAHAHAPEAAPTQHADTHAPDASAPTQHADTHAPDASDDDTGTDAVPAFARAPTAGGPPRAVEAPAPDPELPQAATHDRAGSRQAAPSPSAAASPGTGPDNRGRVRSRRRARMVVASAVGAVAIGAGVVAATGGGDGPATDAATNDPAGTTEATTTTAPPPVAAAEAFGHAGRRLAEAGSFTYAGTVSADDVSDVRPSLWLASEATVEGQVATTTGRLHEVAVAAEGTAAETVADGPTVWGRKAPAVEQLAGVPYEMIPALSDGDQPAKGAALLPTWLAAAVNPLETGSDDQGRRRFQATIPAEVIGQTQGGRSPVNASVALTLDDRGDPARVEITSTPGGPTLHLVFDISGLGAPVVIEPPV